MRDEIIDWVTNYPTNPGWKDGTFASSPNAKRFETEVPRVIKYALGPTSLNYEIKASAGQGVWTHTPWVALLNPLETTSVQEGIYVVYLLSYGCKRLYLTLNQGCTTLKNNAGISNTRTELIRRSDIMEKRLRDKSSRLKQADIDLGTINSNWRSNLYENGCIIASTYQTNEIPSDADLLLDLKEALFLYDYILKEGAFEADDIILSNAISEVGKMNLTEAKVYRTHRSIERNASHSKLVKKLQGTICKGCDKDPAKLYGEIGEGLVDAHHLKPLSTLAEGEMVRLDPNKDFVVLCPNCHRAIHRMQNQADLAGLRALIQNSKLQQN